MAMVTWSRLARACQAVSRKSRRSRVTMAPRTPRQTRPVRPASDARAAIVLQRPARSKTVEPAIIQRSACPFLMSNTSGS